MMRWYAVHTQPKGERLAQDNLTRQGFDAYLPLYSKKRRHARKTDFVPAPLFPRYLFVNMDTEATRWRSIRSTYGVVHLVCQGETPVALPEGVVEAIRARHDEGGLVQLSLALPFKPGEKVEVLDGPFKELTGIFQSISDDQRVIVLLEMLGRPVKVRLPIDAVGSAA
ncbi:Transcription antitermination protein nusG [Rhodospirillaceae bacterium LM-1]|nr:Transcription antitermination protein nusG [Rhodospirillaceae bacterium LM-1]